MAETPLGGERQPSGDGSAPLPYVFRWDRDGRKGQLCAVTARSKAQPSETPLLAFGQPARPRFNSVCIEFADGFATITSGNAIRKARP
jgi:hypothetical protein